MSRPSTVRLFAGPALLVNDESPRVGGWVALDLGRTAAGLRATGAWVDAGSASGVSQYTTEFWLDLRNDRLVRPFLGAGAGLARLGASETRARPADTTTSETHARPADITTVGLGVLRTGLQVLLPVRDTDARAGLEAVGCLPVVRSGELSTPSAWGLVVATVGVGF